MLIIRLATASLLCLSKGVLAAPICTGSPTDPNIFVLKTNNVIAEIDKLSAELDSILRAPIEGRHAAALRIEERVGAVVDTSRCGTAIMRGANTLGLLDTQPYALVVPVNQLTSKTNESSKKWIKIKDIVFQMNGQQVVIGLLQNMKDAAVEFTAVMASRMPVGVKQVGEAYGMAVENMVASVIKEYQSPPPQSGTSGLWWG
jgi:hypothetical protein